MRKTELAGNRYGRLLVLERGPKSGRGQSQWECLCDCGNQKLIRGSSLVGGESLSCGCRKKEPNLLNTKHGLSHTPIYRVWSSMISRCHNPNHDAYENYGARGIKVCEEWKTFEGFFASMGFPPEGLSLDRINNEIGYHPSNCRWATRSEQASNTRKALKYADFN